ncbi:MAG: polysaccharide pyruvyl transferase family protein, partial [Rhodococcus sp. (in: high G+C Gram-positive bacteria)]
TGQAVFAFHGGEVALTGAVLRSYVLSVPTLLALRLRGGAALHTSVGVRADDRALCRALRVVLGLCDLVTWRDETSRDWVGTGTVTPDWAFGEARTVTADPVRTLLAVALRHDRPAPSADYVRLVRDVADAHGLEIVTVAQTGRDHALAAETAGALGARVIEWPSDDLLVAEQVLRQTYRSSFAVVSNRLHGLIMAATEGAVPIGLGTSDVEKLDRSMRAAGLGGLAREMGDPRQTRQFVDDVVARRTEIAANVDAAALEVNALTERIAAAVEARR